MNRPEEALQKQVVAFLDVAARHLIWFAVPNQRGTRKRFEMALLFAMGVKAGVADLVFVLPDGRCAFIELKAPKGRRNFAQRSFETRCAYQGVPYVVCRSLAEVITALQAWGATLSGRIAA